MPEAGEEHEEKAELSEEEDGPDAGLGQHVHGDSGGERKGGEAEERKADEAEVGAVMVVAQGAKCGQEGAADAAVGSSVGAKVAAELDSVDLDQVEVEAKQGGDEQDQDQTGKDEEERFAADVVAVDVVGPDGLELQERSEDRERDQQGEQGDAYESPEERQAGGDESTNARRG